METNNKSLEVPKVKAPRKNYRQAEYTTNIETLINKDGLDWQYKLVMLLNSLKFIKRWAYIIHDKDIDEVTGEIKPPHIHCALEFNMPMNYGTVANHLGTQVSQIQKIKQKKPYGNKWCADVGGLLSYMTHRNCPEKHQYADEEVIAKDDWDWISDRDNSEQIQKTTNIEGIINGIITGEIKKRNITDFIDPHIYIDKKSDIENAFEYRKSLVMKNSNRNMDVIFIAGDPGAGKTTLARIFCEKKDMDCFISGSANDPLQNYGDEDAIIIDDARPNMFEKADWLKILDNHTQSLAKARYKNVLLQAKMMFITTIKPINDFFGFAGEDIRQFFRRCKTYIYLTKNKMEIYEYKVKENQYVLVGIYDNPVEQMYQQVDHTEEEIESIISGFVDLNKNKEE